jgi:hypothetical protein
MWLKPPLVLAVKAQIRNRGVGMADADEIQGRA